MKKRIAMILAVVLLLVIAIGATIAWFTDTTQTVENTFTVGNIDITLGETDNGLDGDEDKNTNDYKMIPGWTITKDPVATVKGGSEDAWLFVEIIESENFDDFMTYAISAGWETVVPETEGVTVIGRRVAAKAENQPFAILKDNEVKVLDTVKKENMDAIINGTDTEPTLNFKAYAVQLYKSNGVEFTAVDAWKVAKP